MYFFLNLTIKSINNKNSLFLYCNDCFEAIANNRSNIQDKVPLSIQTSNDSKNIETTKPIGSKVNQRIEKLLFQTQSMQGERIKQLENSRK